MVHQSHPTTHHRQSIRLPGWDYTSPGAYFVTICTDQREHLFEDERFCEVAKNAWQAIPTHEHAQHVELDEWVLMPNHLHGVLILTESDNCRGEARRYEGTEQNHPSPALPRPYTTPQEQPTPQGQPTGVAPGSVGAIIGNFKSLVTRRVNNLRRTPGGKVWQRGYYDHIVRNEDELNAIRRYIQENPQRWYEGRDNLETLVARMRWVKIDR